MQKLKIVKNSPFWSVFVTFYDISSFPEHSRVNQAPDLKYGFVNAFLKSLYTSEREGLVVGASGRPILKFIGSTFIFASICKSLGKCFINEIWRIWKGCLL